MRYTHGREKKNQRGPNFSGYKSAPFLSALEVLCQFTHDKDLFQNIFQADIYILVCYKTLATILESELIPQ